MRTRSDLLAMVLGLTLIPGVVNAGVRVKHPLFSITIDSFVNMTIGGSQNADISGGSDAENFFVDADMRILALHKRPSGLNWGGRIVVSGATNDGVDTTQLTEASVIFMDDWGIIELGQRQGLPDILTGFAPNNYTFTSSEYGPATGVNLNPAGGLQTIFLDSAIADEINALTPLGFTATLSDDLSEKIIYAAPRSHSGFTTGISFAPDIGDDTPGFKELFQAGLTYDYFWSNNQLHIGGSLSYAIGDDEDQGRSREDLLSVNIGAAMTLDDALDVGLSATYDGDGGRINSASGTSGADAFGWVASVNYNKGRWTYGGFYQQARNAGDLAIAGSDRLKALQVGVSYRFNIRTRVYSAYYYYDLDNESQESLDGGVFLLGVRLIL